MMATENHPLNKKRKGIVGKEEEEEEEEEGEDRISLLPDAILVEILCLIDTKTAVVTSFLSKRWRQLWTFLPSLHFDYSEFLFLTPNYSNTSGMRRRFTSFVKQVLSLRKPSNLFSFSLDCDDFVDKSFVDMCLSHAFRFNVQQLHLFLPYFRICHQFPSYFTNSESLNVLTLHNGNYYISEKESLRLPVLRTLRLVGFNAASHKFISNTVGNCPSLETLELSYMEDLGLITITAPQLSRLELSHFSDCSGIEVSAPMLTSFRFQGYDALPVFRVATPHCLEDAYVDLYPWPWFRRFEASKQRMAGRMINMLEQLREAKSIALSVETLEVLSRYPASLGSRPSPFYNLKHLKLASPRECSRRILPLNVISYLTQGSKVAPTWN